MTQVFYAHPTDTFTWPNGAVGHRPGGAFDTLGPYAKVRNCPIAGTELRLTCYATAYPDTWFSVPAVTRHNGRRVKGFFTVSEGNIEFRVLDSCKWMVGLGWEEWLDDLVKAGDAAGYEPTAFFKAQASAWEPLWQEGWSAYDAFHMMAPTGWNFTQR